MAARVVLESCNSILPRTRRLPSVSSIPSRLVVQEPDRNLAKFTGYQYGGRPLGLTFVKYLNANGGDPMEDTEATGGLTQDQIM